MKASTIQRLDDRKEAADFVKLGPLPDARADEDMISRHQLHLEKIKPPVTDDEAALLISAFGKDDCFGLAWTLLHLIESAPGGVPVKAQPSPDDNEWLHLLWERSHR